MSGYSSSKSDSSQKKATKKISQMLSKIFVILVLISLILGTLLPLFLQVMGRAEVSVVPKAEVSTSDQIAWNLFRLESGKSASGQVEIRNLANKDTIVDIQSNDATVTNDGFFTINSNNESNNGVGKWLEISKGRQAVTGLGGFDLPFSVKVPEGTKDGEYAGAISATEIDENPNNSVALGKRSGSRVYVLVGSDFKIESEAKNLRIIDPSSGEFTNDLKTYTEIDKNNFSFLLTLRNSGNVYAKLVADYELTLADGETKKGNFDRNLTPDSKDYAVAVNTQIPYQKGVSKLKINYKFAPQNNLLKPEEVKFDTSTKSINSEINLQEKDLEKLPSKEKQEQTKTEETKKWYETLTPWLLTIPVVLGILTIAFVVYLITHINKKQAQKK
jgi:hypothetical protein